MLCLVDESSAWPRTLIGQWQWLHQCAVIIIIYCCLVGHNDVLVLKHLENRPTAMHALPGFTWHKNTTLAADHSLDQRDAALLRCSVARHPDVKGKHTDAFAAPCARKAAGAATAKIAKMCSLDY